MVKREIAYVAVADDELARESPPHLLQRLVYQPGLAPTGEFPESAIVRRAVDCLHSRFPDRVLWDAIRAALKRSDRN
jgi:hypothetical protein